MFAFKTTSRTDSISIAARTSRFRDRYLDCGDDAIAITTSVKDRPARNITITNCLLVYCAGIRFWALFKGDFEDISVSTVILRRILGGIKLGVFEGATIRNCVFDNLPGDG